MIPKHVKKLQSDSRHLKTRLVTKNTLMVESDNNPFMQYRVSVRFGKQGEVYARCTCDWARHHGMGCSHVMAALEYLASLKDRTLSFWTNEDDAKRQKQRTFKLVGGSRRNRIWITSRNAA